MTPASTCPSGSQPGSQQQRNDWLNDSMPSSQASSSTTRSHKPWENDKVSREAVNRPRHRHRGAMLGDDQREIDELRQAQFWNSDSRTGRHAIGFLMNSRSERSPQTESARSVQTQIQDVTTSQSLHTYKYQDLVPPRNPAKSHTEMAEQIGVQDHTLVYPSQQLGENFRSGNNVTRSSFAPEASTAGRHWTHPVEVMNASGENQTSWGQPEARSQLETEAQKSLLPAADISSMGHLQQLGTPPAASKQSSPLTSLSADESTSGSPERTEVVDVSCLRFCETPTDKENKEHEGSSRRDRTISPSADEADPQGEGDGTLSLVQPDPTLAASTMEVDPQAPFTTQDRVRTENVIGKSSTESGHQLHRDDTPHTQSPSSIGNLPDGSKSSATIQNRTLTEMSSADSNESFRSCDDPVASGVQRARGSKRDLPDQSDSVSNKRKLQHDRERSPSSLRQAELIEPSKNGSPPAGPEAEQEDKRCQPVQGETPIDELGDSSDESIIMFPSQPLGFPKTNKRDREEGEARKSPSLKIRLKRPGPLIGLKAQRTTDRSTQPGRTNFSRMAQGGTQMGMPDSGVGNRSAPLLSKSRKQSPGGERPQH